MKTKSTQAFWQQHVSQWQKSSLSQAQYCKKHDLKAHSLSFHKRKLETRREEAASSGFIKVTEYHEYHEDTHSDSSKIIMVVPLKLLSLLRTELSLKVPVYDRLIKVS